jgi:hypothetical protein
VLDYAKDGFDLKNENFCSLKPKIEETENGHLKPKIGFKSDIFVERTLAYPSQVVKVQRKSL